ncbi:hypothetical protein Tco_0521551, partial [Tanacetum coccineum]
NKGSVSSSEASETSSESTVMKDVSGAFKSTSEEGIFLGAKDFLS